MKQVVIPNSQLHTSQIGFGTASLHHLFRSQDRNKLLGVAMDSGITHFDTAPMYGEGMAEKALGQFLGAERHKVTITTKFGFPVITTFERFPLLLYAHRAFGGVGRRILPNQWDYRLRSLEVNNVQKSLTRSLKFLRTDWIDLFMLHEPQTTDIDALLKLVGWLEDLRASGCVRHLGLAGKACNCVEVARQIPELFDVLQVEDSIAEHEADDVIGAGWPLQITYGYLRRAAAIQDGIDAEALIKAALARNAKGMVMVSSRNPERLKNLASLANLNGTQQ